MELGQSLTFINACFGIGLAVFTPLASYQEPPDEIETRLTASIENYDPHDRYTESNTEPTVVPAKPENDKSRSESKTIEPSTKVPASWNLLPLANSKSPTLIDKAYLDALTILKEDNACSRFYGGRVAIQALNELVHGLSPVYLDRSIAIRMKGTTSSVQDYVTGKSYRLFQKAEINLNGSFYQGNLFPYGGRISAVGQFQPNTREARVTILLHELGHLLRTEDKQWLLPDDGNDQQLSRKNTDRVISTCRDQIMRLSRLSFGQELVAARAESSPEEAPSGIRPVLPNKEQ